MTAGDSSIAKQPKIVVHWLEKSRAQRIVWLLEELGLDYELKIYKRDENYLAPPELKAIHPLGKSPIVTVDDLVLAESGFIVEYFTSRWERLRPDPSSPAATQYQYLLHYVEGSLMPPFVIGQVMQQIKKSKQIPFFLKPVANMIVNGVYNNYLNSTYEGNFQFLETMLEGKTYFAGEFSGADVLLSFPLVEAAKGRVKEFNKHMYPKLFAWMDRVTAREGYKRAETRTEKFERLG
ncbi:hypothetical protein EV426DRAFT_708086 [Tirmania nivea]|nr:hypothetical protein EV426DRAFT_708086 [Tirmania nivea]